MFVNVLRLQLGQATPPQPDLPSPPRQTGIMICFDATPLAIPVEQQFADQGRRARVVAFLITMAGLSVACKLGGWLVGSALQAWFALAIEPWVLSLALQLMVTLIGTGVAGHWTGAAHDSTARGQVLIALLAAMGIGLILAWLSHFVGRAVALDWPLGLVYLFWAWAATVSAG